VGTADEWGELQVLTPEFREFDAALTPLDWSRRVVPCIVQSA
jgi:hypothetical protein